MTGCLPMLRQQEWAADIAQQLDPDKHTIVLCHHGMRSNMVRCECDAPGLPSST